MPEGQKKVRASRVELASTAGAEEDEGAPKTEPARRERERVMGMKNRIVDKMIRDKNRVGRGRDD
jgi:hypothetical protein